jgi:hypothetical protein
MAFFTVLTGIVKFAGKGHRFIRELVFVFRARCTGKGETDKDVSEYGYFWNFVHWPLSSIGLYLRNSRERDGYIDHAEAYYIRSHIKRQAAAK